MGSTFDPFNQNFTLLDATGAPIVVSVPEVDQYAQYAIRICINYGTQLGASVVLFVILMLLTRSDKRGSAVFILNALALLLNIGRLTCHIVYFTTPLAQFYQYFSWDFSNVPASAYADTILASVLGTLLVVCVEVSLVLQVHVVCSNLRRLYRRLLLGLSVVIALIPILFRMVYMVYNCKAAIKAETAQHISWLESATNIVITISICFFCTVFTTKLGFAIRMRRRLGVRDFGPMKVIFVMGCQTLVIPALFAILQYAVSVPELSSNVLTLVTISLPLSSIWAGVTLDNKDQPNSNRLFSSRHNLWTKLTPFSNDKTLVNSKQDASFTSTMASSMTMPGYPSSGTKQSKTTCYAVGEGGEFDARRDSVSGAIKVETDYDVSVSVAASGSASASGFGHKGEVGVGIGKGKGGFGGV